jgi:hypothetical protein
MDTLNVIVDEQLPINQDFKSLKAEAFAYIQQYSGLEWTNFNASDPGVTILDQVCYALTELGYCNDFAVCDILTDKNNELQVDNQFYLPQNILTTSPVTLTDYIKYIIDGVNGVNNVVIAVAANVAYTAVYQVYLLIDPAINPGDINNICRATFFYLNKCRNIGEMFLMPLPLKTVEALAQATIEIDDKTHLNTIWVEIQNKIRDYVFPRIIQTGYNQQVDNGDTDNDIFDGPLLQNGWVQDSAIGEKKSRLLKTELINLIKNITGVITVSNVVYDDSTTTSDAEILSIKLSIIWYAKGEQLSANAALNVNPILGKPLPSGSSIHIGTAINLQTKLPQGKYRDINSYYSIQNTFPEIFAVGYDSTTSNASDFQIAQSRQLKGYLTLFDQVLANQFSQLANVSTLFSFKNPTSGAPSNRDEFYAVKDALEKDDSEYPVPYEAFAPTYFYQSLYEVPHIKPLLKDNDIFKFSSEITSDTELEIQSWTAYQQDPYNPYMKGLMEFMEDDETNILRRNNILDHLLSRHGESPYIIDAIIDGSVYTGNSLKDRVVFKSLYLQNLGMLSYYRQKGYNFIGANPILPLPKNKTAKPDTQAYDAYTQDFIFNSGEVDAAEELTPQHFIDFSAIELKLGLLLGLKPLYQTFIANNLITGSYADLELAKWMIEQRRGSIFIETWLLGQYYQVEIVSHTDNVFTPCCTITKNLSYSEVKVIERFFANGDHSGLENEIKKGQLSINGNNYAVENSTVLFDGVDYCEIKGSQYLFLVKMIAVASDADPVFDKQVKLIFPKFIYSPAFKKRLDLFLQNTIPVHVTYSCHFVNSQYLDKIITAYVNWYNSLRYHHINTVFDKQQMANNGALAALIMDIKTGEDE